MKIAIVNDIHVGKALVHHGNVRAASHLIEDRLGDVLQTIVRIHSPDLIVNLGDLIRSSTKADDIERYHKQLFHFKSLKLPIIHVIGNHEIKQMSIDDVENLWIQHGFHQKSYGSRECQGTLIIWLGLEMDQMSNPPNQKLPDLQVEWLKQQLQGTKKDTFIFSHYALDNQDTTGNFFYEAMDNRSKDSLFLRNQVNINKIIASCPYVRAVFQAHLHYFHVKSIQNVPYITCPAMGDNICAPEINNNIPEIYTIIELIGPELVVKAYSREYSFAGYEQSIP